VNAGLLDGPVPPKRRPRYRAVVRQLCRLLGGCKWRCWLAPPGTLTAAGEPARRLCRCRRCGTEVADMPAPVVDDEPRCPGCGVRPGEAHADACNATKAGGDDAWMRAERRG
jgi:hypothetical protein